MQLLKLLESRQADTFGFLDFKTTDNYWDLLHKSITTKANDET